MVMPNCAAILVRALIQTTQTFFTFLLDRIWTKSHISWSEEPKLEPESLRFKGCPTLLIVLYTDESAALNNSLSVLFQKDLLGRDVTPGSLLILVSGDFLPNLTLQLYHFWGHFTATINQSQGPHQSGIKYSKVHKQSGGTYNSADNIIYLSLFIPELFSVFVETHTPTPKKHCD